MLNIYPDPVPLRITPEGDVRIGATRVLLDLVVHAFDDGATPEAIVQRFPTLRLADVYAVMAYCMRHRDEVDAYLQQQEGRGRSTSQNRSPTGRYEWHSRALAGPPR